MKLTTGQIHTMFIGLGNIDKADDVRLTGDVRLKMALNQTALEPVAVAYERARSRAFAEVVKSNSKSEYETQAEMHAVDEQMRSVEQDVKIRKLLKSDLRLDDNPKITATMLAQIMPILEGLE